MPEGTVKVKREDVEKFMHRGRFVSSSLKAAELIDKLARLQDTGLSWSPGQIYIGDTPETWINAEALELFEIIENLVDETFYDKR